jgi:phage terminase large subunit-like protein
MHCGIIDELHSIKDRNIYDVSKQSMSARVQPLLFMITTAGFVRESIYDDMYKYAEEILDGIKTDERFLAFVYELDDRSEWTDNKCWEKANPGLGTIKSLETLNEYVQRGKDDSKFLPTLLTKDFNIRETGVGAWLTFEAINNTETFDINNLKRSYAIGGVDLSSVGDLTCASVLIRKNKKFYLLQKYWIPSEKAERKEQEDNVPYSIWKERGFIDFSIGNKIDYTDVTNWFKELRDKYEIVVLWIGYDKWNAQYWTEEMKNNGFQLEEVIQGARTMSAPMKILASDLEAKVINYNNNPILKWCLTNTQIEVDKNENIRPVKGRNPKQRIDGAVSLIDAYVVLQNHYEDYINLTGGK